MQIYKILLIFIMMTVASLGKYTPYSVASKHIGNGKPVMLQLGTKECSGCKQMYKMLEPFMKKHPKYQIYEVLINEPTAKPKSAMGLLGTHSTKTLEEKLKLNGYPYQIFYDASGKEAYRHAGVLTANQLSMICKKLGF